MDPFMTSKMVSWFKVLCKSRNLTRATPVRVNAILNKPEQGNYLLLLSIRHNNVNLFNKCHHFSIKVHEHEQILPAYWQTVTRFLANRRL